MSKPWHQIYCPSGFRTEEPGSSLGDVIQPGMLIAGGPEHCPYLVERVTPTCSNDVSAWSLTGWYAEGGIAERNESARWWLNNWVAVRYAPAPLGIIIRPVEIYDYECPARDFCFIVIAEAVSVQNRAGQLGFVL